MSKFIFKKRIDNPNLGIVRSMEVVKYRETENADYWINVDESYIESTGEDKREKTFASIHLTKDEMMELFLSLKEELFPENVTAPLWSFMTREEWEEYVKKDGIKIDRPAEKDDTEPHE